MTKPPKYTNALINAQSPYLQQHAHNPVNWVEWSDSAFAKARAEDKLVLVSIGYSSCHWCHVMEHESFENEDTAAIMNEYFVCIKVDREERPDIDQVYMDAVQLITGSGGWPLNVFCLPDAKPVHGGTYFPTKNWNQLLFQLHDLWVNRRAEALEYGAKLTDGIKNMDLLKAEPQAIPSATELLQLIENWSSQFDWENGGNARTPKFPLPSNYQFLLSAGLHFADSKALEMLRITLNKMASGGIYDQIDGGFARYAVDASWKIPHFEKMLYDNAQLISLYARAAAVFGDSFYADIARQTIDFIENFLKDKTGLYYSSLDADSEGEEGTYYVWTWEQLQGLPDDVFDVFTEFYTCSKAGNWEHGKNILHSPLLLSEFAAHRKEDSEQIKALLTKGKAYLSSIRKERVMPNLDDKCILSWNALHLEGLATAAMYLKEEQFLVKAENLAEAIEKHFLQYDHYLRIVKEGKASIPAFLEDHAALCSAFIALYQAGFNEKWLHRAKFIADHIIAAYKDDSTGLFYFVSDTGENLIARKKDLSDDVIPSANSQMALAFFKLHHYFGESNYAELANHMLGVMADSFQKFTPWYSNWGQSYLIKAFGLYQLCATGLRAKSVIQEYDFAQYPNVILAAADLHGSIPLFANRFDSTSELRFYLCKDEACFAPTISITEALSKLK